MGAHAEREHRRSLGAWYTPEWLVDRILDTVLADGATPRSVLDPACGDGRFLAAAAARWPDASLHGVDIDVDALTAARCRLGPGARLQHADGLVEPTAGGFDLVVGNPPFLNQLARRSSRGGRSHLGGGPYADTAALFLARALALAAPAGGTVALVLPQSILAARDAEPVRALVAAGAAVCGLWLDEEAVFDAAVHTMVLACRMGQRQARVHRWTGSSFTDRSTVVMPASTSWSPLVADLRGVPDLATASELADGPRLGERAAATADFRDQYYGLVGHVGDDVDGPPLVTTGLVDPGTCAWGRRPVRFAGARYEAPRVAVGALAPGLQTWVARRLVPKVLLATQTSVLEACADVEGRWLPAVPLITIVPQDPDDVWPITAALCSPVASAWAARLTLGTGLSVTALRLRAAQVADVPLPSRPWPEATAALRSGDLDTFGAAMGASYGLDPAAGAALLAWWRPLADRALGCGRRAVRAVNRVG